MSQPHQDNQPEISVDNSSNVPQNKSHNQQKTATKESNPENNDIPNQNHSQDQEYNKNIQAIMHIRQKHPDCIPVFYVKHQASPKQFPSPKIPFILFKKQLKIQQAMYNLYNQIQIKGLYFFCTRYDQKQKKLRYIILKPGETIQQIYNKYGKNGILTLIYGDKNIGMGGINKAQKWLIRVLIVLVMFWVFLFGQPLYYAFEEGGLSGVWEVVGLMWNRGQQKQEKMGEKVDNNEQKAGNVVLQQQHQQSQVITFTQDDILQQPVKTIEVKQQNSQQQQQQLL